MNAPQLDWIDEFVRNIRPYIHIRTADRVLIRMPNHAFKLNESGCALLKFMLEFGKAAALISHFNLSSEQIGEVSAFFHSLRKMLSGTMPEDATCPALEKVEFSLGYVIQPVLSEIALTDRCNIHCRFCYAACQMKTDSGTRPFQRRIGNRRTRDEMTTNQVKRVLSIIRNEADVPSVSFTGGEPMIREDLVDLVGYAANKLKMRVNLITNGTRIDPHAARALKKAGLASAQVSIESARPEEHDEITQVPGSHERSTRGLKSLLEAGISSHPHSTICSINRRHIDEMAGWAFDLGVDRFSANLMIPAGRGALEQELIVRYSEIGPLVLNLVETSRKTGIKFLWYSPTPMCLFNPIPLGLGNKGCSACEGLLSVDPRGNIIPCSSWNLPVGSLLHESFHGIWDSDRARAIRHKKESHPACHECQWIHLCHGACPLYFKVQGYSEIEPFLPRLEICR